MEGRHFAVLASVFFWGLSFLISLVVANAKLSGNLFLKKQKPFLAKHYLLIIFLTTIVVPVLAAFAYQIGGKMEENNGIAWGCYIEDFLLLSIISWFLSTALIIFLMLIRVLRTKKLKYASRKQFLLAFLLPILYAFFMIFATGFAIQHLSGPLSGKESTCL